MQSYLSALDLKLGWRALIKYPVLNLVAGVAIAFAIACATLVFEGVTQILHPRLPLPDGDRVVGIRLWNAASSRVEEQSLYYYASWRNELRSIAELGAFSERITNLADGTGDAATASLAAITASGFRVGGVAPLLGRTFVEADERPGAPLVIILGYETWQQRFAGDENIVGRTVRVGNEPHTVIGVMPEGFGYPIRHDIWTPLRVAATGHEPRTVSSLRASPRLAPGASRPTIRIGGPRPGGDPSRDLLVHAQRLHWLNADPSKRARCARRMRPHAVPSVRVSVLCGWLRDRLDRSLTDEPPDFAPLAHSFTEGAWHPPGVCETVACESIGGGIA